MADPGELVSLRDAAERLGVHYMTAYRYVRTGRLPAVREGAQWLVHPRDLDLLRSPAPTSGAPSGRRRRTDRPATLAARLVDGDEAGAWGAVEAAMTSGMDPDTVYLDLIAPALRTLGDGWAAGTVSIAQEHRATAVTQRMIGRLGPRFARPGRKRGTVVVGAPAGDLHSLPSAMVTDLLRGAGFDVLDVGANAPEESFVESARQASRLVAVLLGVSAPDIDDAVRGTVRALRSAAPGVPVFVGGGAVRDAEHARHLGADGWSGLDGRSVLAAVERAATGPRPAGGRTAGSEPGADSR